MDFPFQKTVKDFASVHFRPMPWRETRDPYAIFLSEVMLQQTQVDRVIPKFQAFIQAFPTLQDLAGASFAEVLAEWSGLGYNRRALWLHAAAKKIVAEHCGQIPADLPQLIVLKGIGPNTAAAICVYAFNRPIPFIETNIRAVYIHHFFDDRDDVSDVEILPLVQETMDTNNPREWYWALMDYGVHLKKLYKNPARRSKHHTVQSRFEGSKRQLRGEILRTLLSGPTPYASFAADERAEKVLSDMERDGLIVRDGEQVKLK